MIYFLLIIVNQNEKGIKAEGQLSVWPLAGCVSAAFLGGHALRTHVSFLKQQSLIPLKAA